MPDNHDVKNAVDAQTALPSGAGQAAPETLATSAAAASSSMRTEIQRELADYLRGLNKPAPFWREIIDRPLLVTAFGSIAGGLLIAWFTGSWQAHIQELQYKRSRQDQKFQLLRVFPTIKDANGNFKNRRIQLMLLQAAENGKDKKDRNDAYIKDWRAERHQMEFEQWKTEPLDGVLQQIDVLFEEKSTRDQVAAMKTKWAEFGAFSKKITDKFKKTETLPAHEIENYDAARTKMVKELNEGAEALIREMALEIVNPKKNKSAITSP